MIPTPSDNVGAEIPPIIRRGLATDADRLTDVALAAKRYWGYPAHWIERWRNELTIEEPYVNSHPLFVAERTGAIPADFATDLAHEILGFYALESKSPTTISLEHLWVLPRAMGHGVGRTLIRHAIAYAQAEAMQWLEIESDPNAEGFYRRMGATCIGSVAYELEGEARRLPLLRIDLRHVE